MLTEAANVLGVFLLAASVVVSPIVARRIHDPAACPVCSARARHPAGSRNPLPAVHDPIHAKRKR